MEHGLTWNDIATILAAVSASPSRPAASSTAQAGGGPEVNVFDMIDYLIEKHVAVSADERTAIALWCLLTYVFERFSISPRLAALSPIRGCGKTTLLIVLESLIGNALRSDNITPAAIYYTLQRNPSTVLLIDEGDNLGIFQNNILRAVFNAGHRRGGTIHRFVRGWAQAFEVFAPLAVAAIGDMPLPLMRRSIVISMQRPAADVQLARLDEKSRDWITARDQISKWAATCVLDTDPKMPPELRDYSARDNWRPLFAIADSLGHGERARAAAIALSAQRTDEDLAVLLLTDLRDVFDTLPPSRWGSDRATGAYLVERLLAREDPPYAEWRGLQGDRPPRKFSQNELARILRPFGIRP